MQVSVVVLKSLVLELSNRCMNQCLHCSSRSHDDKYGTHLNLGQVVSFLAEARGKCGLTDVCLSGGEPMLYGEILELVAWCNSYGLKVHLYTSGIGPGGAAILDWYKLSETVNTVVFSLQSADPYEHNRMTDRWGSFDAVVRSIQAARREGITCECNVVPTQINLGRLMEHLYFAENLGLSRINYLKFVPQGRGYDNAFQLQLVGDGRAHERDVLEKISKKRGLITANRNSIEK